MSNNAYTRPLGVWNPGVVYATELADIDRKTVKAPNFDGGGTYAPTAPIIVGGSGMTLTLVGASTAEGFFVTGTFDVAVGANAYFRGSTQFRDGSSAFFREAATLTFRDTTGATFEAGSFLNVDATTNIGGDLTIAGRTSITGPLDFSNAVNVGGTASVAFYSGSDLSFAGGSSVNMAAGSSFACVGDAYFAHAEIAALDLTGAGSLQAKQVCSGSGRVVRRYSFIASTGANSSAYGPANTDRVVVNALTADVTFTINNTDVQDGDEIVFVNKDTTHTLGVADPSSGILLNLRQASGSYQSATFYYHAGTWEVLTRDAKI